MADDLDVEAMLEAPYRKEDDGRGDATSERERRCGHNGELEEVGKQRKQ